jgi:hypothetical protein
MKKITILLASLFVFVTLRAQLSEVDETWQFGLNGGMGFNGLSGGSTYNAYEGKQGFTAGPYIEYRLSEIIQVRVELNIEQRNFNSATYAYGLRDYDTSSYVCADCYYIFDVNYTNSYLTVPVYGQYTKKQNNLSFGFRLGLYYSILLNSWNQGFEELYIDPKGAKPFSLENLQPGLYRIDYASNSVDVINTFDSGIILAVFAKYNLGERFVLQADGSLHLGFTGLFENPSAPVVNNRAYQIRLGIGFKPFLR